MIRRFALMWVVALSVLIFSSFVYAVQDKGQGTLNHDYFAMLADTEDPHSRWLVNDIERNHLDKAIFYVREGRLKQALNDCIYLLERLVNHPKGLAVLGMVAKLVKQPALPLKYYENALRLYPQYAITHAQYGKYLADIGNPKAGIPRLKRAIEINPKLTVSYRWLAQVYAKNGQATLARQILEDEKRARLIDTSEKQEANEGVSWNDESALNDDGSEAEAQ